MSFALDRRAIGAGRRTPRRCVTLALARAGATVLALGRTESSLMALAKRAEAAAGRVLPYVADINDGDQMSAAMTHLEEATLSADG